MRPRDDNGRSAQSLADLSSFERQGVVVCNGLRFGEVSAVAGAPHYIEVMVRSSEYFPAKWAISEQYSVVLVADRHIGLPIASPIGKTFGCYVLSNTVRAEPSNRLTVLHTGRNIVASGV